MSARPCILIVDDEPFNVDYLEQELDDLDFDTVSAGDGIEALAVLEDRVPDVILLDIMMPRMDGFETLARLKASEAWRSVPVIVISAMTDMASVVRGIEMGADDYLPKPFDPVILQARLRAGLEKKRLHDLEEAYTRSLERELEIGKEIQAGFLPEKTLAVEGWEIAAYFRAAREVAGDFYDVFELPDGKIALMVGDVTDKGVGAALYMALYRTLLRATAGRDGAGGEAAAPGSPGEPAEQRLERAVAATNRYICRVHKAPQFVTLFFGILDPASGRLVYISAGHDPAYHLQDGAIHRKMMPTGPAVGLFEEAAFGTDEIELADGDLLFVYTDGVIDLQNGHGERFGQGALRIALADGPAGPGEQVVRVTAALDEFAQGARQFDDVTILAVGRKP